jgi:hypothetical protein
MSYCWRVSQDLMNRLASVSEEEDRVYWSSTALACGSILDPDLASSYPRDTVFHDDEEVSHLWLGYCRVVVGV